MNNHLTGSGALDRDKVHANPLPKETLDADPEGCDSVPKSVEGVDGQDSVWSSIHPPASSSKRNSGTRFCHISNLLCDNKQDCRIQ